MANKTQNYRDVNNIVILIVINWQTFSFALSTRSHILNAFIGSMFAMYHGGFYRRVCSSARRESLLFLLLPDPNALSGLIDDSTSRYINNMPWHILLRVSSHPTTTKSPTKNRIDQFDRPIWSRNSVGKQKYLFSDDWCRCLRRANRKHGQKKK